jgi:DNA-binding transcriptional LysR family regulator
MIADDLDVSVPQLRCFVAVVEAASLAEAGRRLGMSAASVSKAIARLEQSAGVRLLHRSTHAFSLTPEGEALLEPAKAVLAAAVGFRDIAGEASAGSAAGVVRISVAVGLSRAVLAPLLGGFRQEHPDIHIDVRATNEIVSLADDGVDVALRSGSLERVPGHVQQRWLAFPWVFCAAPGYLDRKGVPEAIEDLRSHDLIGFRNLRTGQVQGWPYRAADGSSARLAPAVGLVFDDGDSGWQAALAGAGIACAPLYLAAQALRDGRAVEVLRPFRDEPVELSIVRRERRLTPPRVTALVQYLLQHAPILSDLD